MIFEDVSLKDLTIRQVKDVAWATGRFRALTVRKSDKTKWKFEIYTSFVLKRSGKTWQIVFEQSTRIAGVPRVQPRK